MALRGSYIVRVDGGFDTSTARRKDVHGDLRSWAPLPMVAWRRCVIVALTSRSTRMSCVNISTWRGRPRHGHRQRGNMARVRMKQRRAGAMKRGDGGEIFASPRMP